MNKAEQYRELMLERLRYSLNGITAGLTIRCRVDWMPAQDALLTQLQWELAGIRKKVEDIVYPTTWWDAVKDHWLPKWARRWAPVQYTRVVVERHSTVPDFALPKEYGPIRVGLYENKYNFSDPPEGEDE